MRVVARGKVALKLDALGELLREIGYQLPDIGTLQHALYSILPPLHMRLETAHNRFGDALLEVGVHQLRAVERVVQVADLD